MQRWEDLATVDFADFDWRETVAVLPLAAVEQHGPHLPLGTDAFICEAIVDEALSQFNQAATAMRRFPVLPLT
jgi:creatinine amidohydrolase